MSGDPELWPRSVQQSLCLVLTGAMLVIVGFWMGRTTSPAAPVAPTPIANWAPGNSSPNASPANHETKVVAAAGVAIPLNRASAEDLDLLPGIGPVLAKRIVDYREAKGPFQSIEDLRKVTGIGAKTLDKIRPHLTLERKEALVARGD